MLWAISRDTQKHSHVYRLKLFKTLILCICMYAYVCVCKRIWKPPSMNIQYVIDIFIFVRQQVAG